MKLLIRRLKPVQVMVAGYAFAGLLSTLLLLLPIAQKPGVNLSFVDAWFTATSAISVTGLAIANTAETFTLFGQIVILCTIQIGGIGFMTLGTFIWVILGRKVGLRNRLVIQWDQNQTALSGMVTLIKRITVLAFVIEGTGAVILGTYLMHDYPWYQAFYLGIFHAVSAFTHAGFDLFSASLIPFQSDLVINGTVMLLIILGGIGYPVLIELMDYRKDRHLSLHSKLSLTIYFSLMLIGFIVIYLVEAGHAFRDYSLGDSLLISMFTSVTSRSAGLATIDVNLFMLPTVLFITILMFIGASPSSCGGGIRTTTLAILILTIRSFARGEQEVRVMGRQVHPLDVNKAIVVGITAVGLFMTGLLLMAYWEGQRFTLMQMMFEISSAFGTCGLSLGITSQLSSFSKVILICLMFIGRIGLGALLLLIQQQDKKATYHFPKERVIVG
ncbi:TrkH family potassium uptake protein [Rubeoparvulum massiliense]|uniref:TrkH family potassium uptake protein n=1 Tax=Rubeoparvulum massiliense TaxID=1631346 RepID=UPI00065E35FA|nr:potassium transporter TrkG [Rubeoparvulum massiliense]